MAKHEMDRVGPFSTQRKIELSQDRSGEGKYLDCPVAREPFLHYLALIYLLKHILPFNMRLRALL